MITLPRSYPWGNFESVNVERCGILRINGWSRDDISAITKLRVNIDDKEQQLLNSYRIYRPDVATAFDLHDSFLGFSLEYLFYPRSSQGASTIEIEFDNEKIFQLDERVEISIPHYDHLFSESKVLHRNNIYGYGPPGRVVSSEVLALSKSLQGPIIDFGCGSGALVKELRSLGLQAFGIEINRLEIMNAMFEEVRPYITLYDGSLPLPFGANSFESGICVEVLEHITNLESALKELSRIIRNRLIITVPDISSIPILHQHSVVPWHLLESTHVNFFTQKSLRNLLNRFFDRVEFARIGTTVINGTRFYVSLVAICEK